MPYTGAFVPPKVELSVGSDKPANVQIGSLAVSDSWKQKFRLIRKAGGPRLQNLKALASSERFRIGFNVLAFFFGPIYYAAKGMWRKALSLFGICLAAILVIGFALDLAGLSRVADALGYATAAIFAVRANVDYYKKTVLGDNGWW